MTKASYAEPSPFGLLAPKLLKVEVALKLSGLSESSKKGFVLIIPGVNIGVDMARGHEP